MKKCLNRKLPCIISCRTHWSSTLLFYDDDDSQVHLLTTRTTPVQFRTSPPLEAVKPERRTLTNKGRSMSPPPKLLHYEVSPRKRTKHARHAHIQRPYLDFEKMQQVSDFRGDYGTFSVWFSPTFKRGPRPVLKRRLIQKFDFYFKNILFAPLKIPAWKQKKHQGIIFTHRCVKYFILHMRNFTRASV